jgi:hypothetical protein
LCLPLPRSQTFGEAVAAALQAKGKDTKEWLAKAMTLNNREARAAAKALLGEDIFWCWEAPRTAEGYYRVLGGTEYAIHRHIHVCCACGACIWPVSLFFCQSIRNPLSPGHSETMRYPNVMYTPMAYKSISARVCLHDTNESTLPCSLRRAAPQFAPYADICWMESAKPEKAQAQQFAEGVLAVHPKKLLTYNLSPSFNWDATGMTDEEIRSVLATSCCRPWRANTRCFQRGGGSVSVLFSLSGA